MRKKERIPKIIKFFKNNKKAFNEINNIKKGNYHKTFLDNYEELFALWYENPDLRFTQLLINEGVVPDNGNWSKEESYFLIDKGYFKAKELYLWGSYGLDSNEKFNTWLKDEPVFGEPITTLETWLNPSWQSYDEKKLFGIRFHKWMNNQPTHQYFFLEDLSSDHIKNILLIPNVSYKKVFEEILKERENGL